MAPGLLAEVKVQRLDRLLRSLLGGEAGPLVPAGLARQPGELEVVLSLAEPVPRPGHGLSILR